MVRPYCQTRRTLCLQDTKNQSQIDQESFALLGGAMQPSGEKRHQWSYLALYASTLGKHSTNQPISPAPASSLNRSLLHLFQKWHPLWHPPSSSSVRKNYDGLCFTPSHRCSPSFSSYFPSLTHDAWKVLYVYQWPLHSLNIGSRIRPPRMQNTYHATSLYPPFSLSSKAILTWYNKIKSCQL